MRVHLPPPPNPASLTETGRKPWVDTRGHWIAFLFFGKSERKSTLGSVKKMFSVRQYLVEVLHSATYKWKNQYPHEKNPYGLHKLSLFGGKNPPNFQGSSTKTTIASSRIVSQLWYRFHTFRSLYNPLKLFPFYKQGVKYVALFKHSSLKEVGLGKS